MAWEEGGRRTFAPPTARLVPGSGRERERETETGGGGHTERDNSKAGFGKVLLLYVSLTKCPFILISSNGHNTPGTVRDGYLSIPALTTCLPCSRHHRCVREIKEESEQATSPGFYEE